MMAGFEAAMATLSTGAMCTPSQLGDALRDLASQGSNNLGQLTQHIDENMAAHDELRASMAETRQMVQAIEGPFNVLSNAIGHIGGTAEVVTSTLLQRIVSLENTANMVTGELVTRVTQLQNTVQQL